MMITFSTSAMVPFRSRPYFTLYSTTAAPASYGPAQLEVGDHARDQRQPEGERTEDEHGDHREPGVDVEGDVGADQAALHAADAARERQQVAEHPHEEALDQH